MSNGEGIPHAGARLALLGLGRMGLVHAQAIRNHLPEVELVAVAEPSAESVARASTLIGDAQVYQSALEALNHPELDGCVVVTPTDSHEQAVAAAIERGLAIFCEKPLTLEREASERLARAATQAGSVLQVGFWRRFATALVEAKRLLASGAIGAPVFARCAQWDVDGPPAAWCDPARSGGIFVDMGVHEFDQLEWLLDRQVVRLEARPLRLVNEELAEVGDYDNAAAWLEFEDGARGLIDLSRNGRYGDDARCEILGSDGAIFIDTWPIARVRLGSREGLVETWRADGDGAFEEAVAREVGALTLAIDSKESEAPTIPGARDSIRATALGVAARDSAAAGGEPVDVALAGREPRRT